MVLTQVQSGNGLPGFVFPEVLIDLSGYGIIIPVNISAIGMALGAD
jgi:hypothetical protein